MKKYLKRIYKNTKTTDFYLNKNRAEIHPKMRRLIKKLFGNIANQSPYSISCYNKLDKNWDSIDTGSYRFSDHWNFSSYGKIHAITNKKVTKSQAIALCDENNVWNIIYQVNYQYKKNYVCKSSKYKNLFIEIVKMTKEEIKYEKLRENKIKEQKKQTKLKEKMLKKPMKIQATYKVSVKKKSVFVTNIFEKANINNNWLQILDENNSIIQRFNLKTNQSLVFKVIS